MMDKKKVLQLKKFLFIAMIVMFILYQTVDKVPDSH